MDTDRRQSLQELLEATGWTLNDACKPAKLTAEDNTALVKAFTDYDCADLVKRQNTVFLNATDSIEYALAQLKECGLSSAPVVAEQKDVEQLHGDGLKNVCGMFSHEDAVTAVMAAYAKEQNRFEVPNTLKQTVAQGIASKNQAYRSFKTDGRIFQVTGNQSILEVLHEFQNKHRLVVVPSGQGVVEKPLLETLGIISQFDIVAFLSLLQLDIANKTIYSLNHNAGKAEDKLGTFVHSPVVMDDDRSVAMAFAHIVSEKVHSVPVVNRKTRMFIGHISASDIHWVVQAGGKMDTVLRMTLEKFCQHKTEPLHYVLPKENTLADAMRMMKSNRVHQVWVCDQPGRKIVGIITCADIVRFFARRLYGITGGGLDWAQGTPGTDARRL